MGTPTVCMLSCLHGLYDDRIYWKEALSLKKHGYNVIHIGIGEEDKDFISEHGIRLISLQRKTYLQNPFADKMFRSITFRKNIYTELFMRAAGLYADVYHMHDIQLNRIGPKLKRLHYKPKIVYDVHEPYPEIIRFLHRRKGIIKVLRNVVSTYVKKRQFSKSRNYDLIITTEEFVANSFKRENLKQKVQIVYNYSNLEKDKAELNPEIKYDAIYSGGISSFRGIWLMVETALLAKERNIDLKILILGNFKEPHLKVQVEKTIKSNRLENHIELKSFVPFQQVKEYYKKSRCGLVIFEDIEVYRYIWPIKTFEYMCFGLPIVTSNFGHTYELVKKHNCGVGINSFSSKELFNNILVYKNSNDTFNTHSSNAINSFLKYYQWKSMEKKLISLYKELVELNPK